MAFENVDYTSLDIPAAPFSDPARIPDFPKNKVPRHVGVIMDGNGRWAQQRGLVRTDGHQAAEPVVFDTIAGAIEAGVRYLSLYTFSTENWKRSPQEVRFLMGFSRDIIHRRVEQMDEWGVRVRWSGRRPKLWKSVIDELEVARRTPRTTRPSMWCSASTTVAAPKSPTPAPRSRARCGRHDQGRPRHREDDRRPPVQPRYSRLRSGDPHLRRAAHVQLPAVGGRLRRT